MSFDVKKKIEELNKSDIISGSNARGATHNRKLMHGHNSATTVGRTWGQSKHI